MSATEYGKDEYLLLFRGNGWAAGLTPEQTQREAGKFMDWFQTLRSEGKCKGGQPLQRIGRVVSGKGGSTVIDGPFAEAKEGIGGYFLIVASSMDEAVKIAKGCPSLDRGMIVEVRPVAETCPEFAAAQAELAHAAA